MNKNKEKVVNASNGKEIQDPKLLFKRLYKRAIEEGLTQSDFSRLEALQEIKSSTNTPGILSVIWNIVFKILIAIFILMICLAFVFLSEWPVDNKTFFRIWFNIKGLEHDTEQCAVEMNEYLSEMARSPTSCEFCLNVSSVQKESNLSPERFERLYAYTSVPVVITDGTKNWTASKHFSYQFFKSLYAKGSPALKNVDDNCQFFPYKTNFTSLEEVFDMDEDRALMKGDVVPWYIGWSNCDLSAANTLRQHYDRPYFLPRIAESSKTDWIFMGSPGYGAQMHIDDVSHPSWQAQITGTKRWTLEPPPECYYQCPKSVEVVVHPGDIIVLDTNRWYHSTLNVGNDISITIGSEYD